MSDQASLEARLDSFLDFAHEVTRGYLAAAPACALQSAEHFHRIADVAETSAAFTDLIKYVAVSIARYQPGATDALQTRKGRVRIEDPTAKARSELASFLRRANVYQTFGRGERSSAPDLARGFLADVAQPLVAVRHLVPIDGLYLAEGTEMDLGAARLLRLDKGGWDRFFEADLYAAPDTADLANFGALEVIQVDQERPTGMGIFFGLPEARVAKVAEPWVTYLCLSKGKMVEPCALYSKPDTRLTEHPVRTVQLHPPSLEERVHDDEGNSVSDWVPIYELEVEAPDSLRDFMLEMHAHREVADTRGTRLSTALHWYRRATRQLFPVDRHLFRGREVDEDSLTDAFTALEAALLQTGEAGKGPKIAARGAGLLSSTDQDFRDVESALKTAYALRNDLVHGDGRPDRSQLTKSAEFVREATRKVLVAALRLEGDQAPLVTGATDGNVRALNRRLIQGL